MKIFKSTRIGFNEMYEDATTFLQEKYKQSKQVFTIASPFGQLLTVFISLTRVVFFFVEDLSTESNILTAQTDIAIQGKAALVGHSITRSISAQGNTILQYNGKEIDMYGNTLLFPKHFVVKSITNGLKYTLRFNNDYRFQLSPNKKIEVNIIQGEYEAQSVTGTGEKLQSFAITVDKGTEIENDNIKVYVNSEEWEVKNSIQDLNYNEKACIVKSGMTSGIDIFFGNGQNGMPPSKGSKIVIEYLKTVGEIGNLRNDEINAWQFMDSAYDLSGAEIDINEFFNLKLKSDISFGANTESIELTKLIAPKISKSLILANETNYITFFEKFNYFSIIDAFTTYDDNNISDDKTIYLILVPDINKRLKSNEDYFSVPISAFRLSESEKEKIYTLLNESEKKMTHIENQILDVSFAKYAINISLSIFENFNKESIQQSITSIISEYFLNLRRRKIVPKSDLIALIENIDGVDSVSLNFVSEKNENSKKSNSDNPLIGLNEFGDIEITDSEIALIRGGWYDRNGNYIYDTLDASPSMLNIYFRESVNDTYNSQKHQIYLKKQKKDGESF